MKNILLTLIGIIALTGIIYASNPDYVNTIEWARKEWAVQKGLLDIHEYECQKESDSIIVLMDYIHETAEEERADMTKIFFTSYNPVKAQTDGTPCIGASGKNLCGMNKRGKRTMALSQDLLYKYEWGDEIYIDSDNEQCRGFWILEDTMNSRWEMRGDLFFMNKKDNTSCWGYIQ